MLAIKENLLYKWFLFFIKCKLSNTVFKITLTEHNAGSIRKCIALLSKLRKVTFTSIRFEKKKDLF